MTALTDDTLPITPRAMRDEMIAFAIMAGLLALVPLTGIYPFFVMQALCFALVACAFNLLVGYGGLLSFGHAMFLGTAGYCSGHALKVWGLPPELGILVGTLVGTIAAALIGPLIVRLRGVYFAMVTIAFGQVFYFIAFRWNAVTGGDDGLTGWTRMPLRLGFTSVDILHNPRAFYYLILVIFAIAVAVMAWLLLGESLTPLTVAGLVIASIGCFFVGANSPASGGGNVPTAASANAAGGR